MDEQSVLEDTPNPWDPSRIPALRRSNRVDPQPDPLDQAVGVRLGPCVLVEPLVAGQGGVVFDALQAIDGHAVPVAVHVPFASHQMDPQFQDRYLEETRVCLKLRHPQLVAVLDGGINGMVWRTMERVSGWTLAGLLRRARLQSVDVPVPVMQGLINQLAAALTFLHGMERVHGRLSSSRILVTASGGVKICGWASPGLAPRAAATATTPAAVTDLAPEQLLGERVDERTDVYHLSLIAACMLLGENPLVRGTTSDTRLAVLNESLELPSFLPASLRAAIAQGLQKSPSARPETVSDWLAPLLADTSEGEEDSVETRAWRSWVREIFPAKGSGRHLGWQAEAQADAEALRLLISEHDRFASERPVAWTLKERMPDGAKMPEPSQMQIVGVPVEDALPPMVGASSEDALPAPPPATNRLLLPRMAPIATIRTRGYRRWAWSPATGGTTIATASRMMTIPVFLEEAPGMMMETGTDSTALR